MEASLSDQTDGIAPPTETGLGVRDNSVARLREVFEVTPREGGWQVKRTSNSTTVSMHSTIQAATEHAKSLAYEYQGEYSVRGPDGNVITRDRLGRYSSLPPASTVNMFEARNSFSKLLERVEAGETILITKAGKAVAKLCPHTLSTQTLPPHIDAPLSLAVPDDAESQHG